MNMLGGMFGGGGMGLGPMNMGFGGHGHSPAPPSAFNKPYRAYSSAIHEIQQGRGNAGAHVTDGGRTQVMFGGQSGFFHLSVCFHGDGLTDLFQS